MGKKRKNVSTEEKKEPELPPAVRSSDEPPVKKGKWTNKQRVLIFSSRGITYRDRHLMQNLRTLLPHSKSECKMEKKDSLTVINEICEMKNCSKCIYFENKKRKDLYMWISNVPSGPSAKFLVENTHTMEELKLTGNCLKGSRPIVSFDKNFKSQPYLNLLQELFKQVFSTPNHHPKSQPFIDHVYTFSILDKKIWFRNYQIVEEDGSLAEIGPRFVLNPIKIFDGSFGGQVLYTNPNYVAPSTYRKALQLKASYEYKNRVEAKKSLEMRRPEVSYNLDPLNEIFQTIPAEEAKGKEKHTFYRSKD
ncbi:ribosome biogenesis protein BRX1 homolog isoform X2 [Centruroides sculpturatus]|uniref:ribosome biogenesis protein BRX1 homolog isoform X1 n=1 Tax=Centruroides sculpturatus TaxID=218467 RepID=UPI000C6ED54B|nr:ribosome biogenesis protein BRX1 homolog isoform X1 [Centruroides sculpturatus]XP_023228785.1 ribosome biogenesis protein BRX1 homolog isoform X2 [Centruroides sculpturatus]